MRDVTDTKVSFYVRQKGAHGRCRDVDRSVVLITRKITRCIFAVAVNMFTTFN